MSHIPGCGQHRTLEIEIYGVVERAVDSGIERTADKSRLHLATKLPGLADLANHAFRQLRALAVRVDVLSTVPTTTARPPATRTGAH